MIYVPTNCDIRRSAACLCGYLSLYNPPAVRVLPPCNPQVSYSKINDRPAGRRSWFGTGSVHLRLGFDPGPNRWIFMMQTNDSVRVV
ncbi:hypothetical protein TNCV_3129791 [Trichonephila clavipes]|nr:hypothetical protein TNCV_3129791 [Trichonephila clavipes]